MEYVAAGAAIVGMLIGIFGAFNSGQNDAAAYRAKADLARQQAYYNQYIANAEAANALWQAKFSAELKSSQAAMARYEAGLTFAQAEALARTAQAKRILAEQNIGLEEKQIGLKEQDIQFEEDKAFNDLTLALSTKRAMMGRSGIRVDTGSIPSYLASYYERKGGEITTETGLKRGGLQLQLEGTWLERQAADLDLSSSIFSSDVLRSRGSIQLDEAALAESYVPYILGEGQYQADLIRTKADLNSRTLLAQAGIYGNAADQSITAGWLNAGAVAGRGTASVVKNWPT
jgi:hypothetical protein